LEIDIVVENKSEILVKNKGQITIPVRIRKKFNIEEGTHLQVVETKEGILLKRKTSFWDTIGSGSKSGTVEEMNALLDKLRHENE